jgi:putative membrane protein insertion efficiency factor
VKLIEWMLLLLIRVYRLIFSPLLTVIFAPLGLGCRFTPTCSEYALEAVQKRGAWRGSLLAARRICRCHPWGGSGYDPVDKVGRVTPCAPPNTRGTYVGKSGAHGAMPPTLAATPKI